MESVEECSLWSVEWGRMPSCTGKPPYQFRGWHYKGLWYPLRHVIMMVAERAQCTPTSKKARENLFINLTTHAPLTARTLLLLLFVTHVSFMFTNHLKVVKFGCVACICRTCIYLIVLPVFQRTYSLIDDNVFLICLCQLSVSFFHICMCFF